MALKLLTKKIRVHKISYTKRYTHTYQGGCLAPCLNMIAPLFLLVYTEYACIIALLQVLHAPCEVGFYQNSLICFLPVRQLSPDT